MKKVFAVITTVVALAVILAFSAFAVEEGAAAGSDTGVFSALILILQGYNRILFDNFKAIIDPIFQVFVWIFDQVWGLLKDAIAGALS